MKLYFNVLILIICSLHVKAATFWVTSKNDSGIGTLREAITAANSNGTASIDYIYFNLQGVAQNDVTISLTQALPSLTSNIIIDATTQPTSLLGNPSIRVVLTRLSIGYINGLKLAGVEQVKIFGLYFRNFVSPSGIPADDRTAAIYLENSKNITIGEAGKSNGFGNNYTSVISPTYLHVLENIKISANIIGLNPIGTQPEPNYVGIDLSYLSNSIIGGQQPQEGNIISSNDNGVSLGAMVNKVEFLNNVIGYDITKTRIFNGANGAIALFVNGEFAEIVIANNYILAHEIGIKLDNLKNSYILSGNTIGGTVDGRNRKYGIELYNCLAGSISNDNVISYNAVGIYVDRSYPVSILRNSFNCNIKAIDFVNLPNNKTVTTSKISNITATNVNGVYLPNSKIELFYTDACSDCQGKDWIATIATNSTGNWSYNGAIDLSRSVTSMGTNPDGATATFSKPLIDETRVTITNVICNQPTGSIKGIATYDASIFEWRNASGAIVGNAKDLENVGPGTYKLTARQNNSCSVISQSYTISSNSTGISEANKVITAAYCGQSNGSIKGITTLNGSSKIWYNSAGTEVSRAADLLNVPSGIYYFTTQLGTCNIISPNYTVNNVEFDYKVSREQVNDASCSSSNGSIQVMGFQTVQPDELRWFNASGSEIGRGPSISNLSPGTYTLKGYSNFGCSYTIKSYSITRIPLPVINQAAQKLYVNCDGTKGSIKGISVNGQTAPYTYTWFNANGDEVASGIELNNVPLDKYYLSVTDRFGCEVLSDVADFGTLKITPIKVPNAFTPNGDAINDVWKIEGVDNYPDATFNVFDRTGNKVFTSKGYNKPFDGTQAGNNLPVGVYFYKIILSANCDPLTGSLTIIR